MSCSRLASQPDLMWTGCLLWRGQPACHLEGLDAEARSLCSHQGNQPAETAEMSVFHVPPSPCHLSFCYSVWGVDSFGRSQQRVEATPCSGSLSSTRGLKYLLMSGSQFSHLPVDREASLTFRSVAEANLELCSLGTIWWSMGACGILLVGLGIGSSFLLKCPP